MENISCLDFFLKGQFYEHRVLGKEINVDKTLLLEKQDRCPPNSRFLCFRKPVATTAFLNLLNLLKTYPRDILTNIKYSYKKFSLNPKIANCRYLKLNYLRKVNFRMPHLVRKFIGMHSS